MKIKQIRSATNKIFYGGKTFRKLQEQVAHFS